MCVSQGGARPSAIGVRKANARRAYPEIAHQNPLTLLDIITQNPKIIALI